MPAPAPSPASPRLLRLLGLGLSALVLAAFAPVLGNGFVGFDDPGYIYENVEVRQGLTWHGVKWALTTTHMAQWNPLAWFSHMLDVTLFGLWAPAHHAHSLLLHLATTLLLFRFLHRMTGLPVPAAVAALAFGVHPLRVESVAWLSERRDVLAGFLFVLTLELWRRNREQPAPVTYAGSVGSHALALASKPSVVPAPLLLVLLDFWPGATASGRLVRRTLPFFAVSAVGAAVTVFSQRSHSAIAGLETVSIPLRLGTALVAPLRYLNATLVPVELFPHHPNLMPGALELVGGAVVLATLIGLVIGCWRRQRLVSLGLGWFLLFLLPVSGVLSIGSHGWADRYTYLPSMGLGLVLVGLLAKVRPSRLVAAAAPVAALLAVLTALQAARWRDNETLFTYMLEVDPTNGVALMSLSAVREDQGRLAEALELAQAAVPVRPGDALAHHNVGRLLVASGKPAEALGSFELALRLKPDLWVAHGWRGRALAASGRVAEAVPELATAAARLASPQLELELAAALGQLGRTEEALQAIARAEPGLAGSPEPPTVRGITLARGGRLQEALAAFDEALRRAPDFRPALEARARVVEDLGKR